MRRLAVVAAVTAAVAGVAVSSAHAALFFLFKPTAADAGSVVNVRLGGTPADFIPQDAERPLRNGIRLYLVRRDVAGKVRSRFDPRLHFVGRIVPDRNLHGVLSFTVPPLDTGAYAVAAWCPGCAPHSFGRTLFVQTVPKVSRFRRWMGLRVHLPSATETCPVTRGTYGNGFFSMPSAPNGVLVTQSDLGQKLGWIPREGFTGALTVRGERLDAPSAPMKVLGVFWGYSSTGEGSWASAVRFPSEGCWRLTGRVGDLTLSFVVRVVRG